MKNNNKKNKVKTNTKTKTKKKVTEEKDEKIEIVEELDDKKIKYAKKIKMGFFKKLKISLFGFEQYPVIGMEKLRYTFSYLIKLIAIFALIISIVMGAKELDVIQSNPEAARESYINLVETYNISITQEQLDSIFSSNNVGVLVGSIVVAMFIVMFVVFLLNTLLDAFATAIMGYFASRIVGLPLKFKALFNMAVSAVTLSVILTCIYLVANITTGFTINYFQAMYVIISFICLFAAILMMKMEILKGDKEKTEDKTKKIQKQSMEEENKVQ